MNVIQEIKDLKRRFNFLRKQYEEHQEPTNDVKRYKALLTQSGTDAPIAVVLENNLGNVNYTYDAEGLYSCTTDFTINKNKTIYCIINPNDDSTGGVGFFAGVTYTNINTIVIGTLNYLGAACNGVLNNTFFLIEVYP